MPLNYQWRKLKINQKNINKFITEMDLIWKPMYIAFDTETSGLHLTEDYPNYLSLAFVSESGEAIAAGFFIDEIDETSLRDFFLAIFRLSSRGFLIGHNLPFDLNMIHNIGNPVTHRRLVDTMVLIRLTTDAVQKKYGGAPLRLKDFTAQYIDPDAKAFAKKVDSERTAIASKLNRELFQKLKKKDFEKNTSYPYDVEDLPEKDKIIYDEWYNKLPKLIKRNMTGATINSSEVPYSMVPREILAEYGVYDAIYTYEIFDRTYPLIDKRAQRATFDMEMELTYPLYKMTREGFHLNKEYIFETRKKMKAHIIERTEVFHKLAGADITVSQAKEILKILKGKYGLKQATSTNEAELSQLQKKLKKEQPHHPAIEFIDIIFELRGLSKGYGTYLTRFYNIAQNYDTAHTTANPAGAVTGRFTSDFQQFPRDGIKDNEGNSLFHPRKIVTVPDDDHYLLFIDYSQMELRIQALYTILLDNPDKNLCQAYMPYLCYHYETKETYDYKSKDHIERWDEKQPNGKSAWLFEGTDEPWEPTDVHAQTTAAAYPDVPRGTKEFTYLRKNVGKHANFACNYGAKTKRIFEMFPDMSWDEADKVYKGYKSSFPGTIYFHQWCYSTIAQNGYGENLFNRRYYGMSGHNYSNAAIQGTGADLLKNVMIKIYKFLEPHKTKMIMTVHDELVFNLHRDELVLIPKLMNIMEELDGTYVPIVVEAEISRTTWAEKKGFEITHGLLKLNT